MIYEGDFANGLAHGTGKLFDKDGNLQYSGIFDHDRIHGWGKSFRADGTLEYSGIFAYGETTGEGFSYIGSGIKWIPEFEAKTDSKRKTVIYPNGAMYSGSFSGGQAEGKGKLTSLFGEVIAEGLWKDGQLETGSGMSMKRVSVSDSVDYNMVTRSDDLRRYESKVYGFEVQLPDNWIGKPLEIMDGPGEFSIYYASPSRPERKDPLLIRRRNGKRQAQLCCLRSITDGYTAMLWRTAGRI
ncbi:MULTISPECIES: hypothetical protein [unclassified Paenibacillus]|uniref:hypothetical protein n=1 Tax=unclassified Paenibacillus TaxID=185978 RepID=UPI001AEA8009|nr:MULTISPECIES: hypothetical protein [unclassified Paenibacillus]MBP1154666.1 hypothetical protein [Paenibacillus sp. PvP091]MBP1169950.1 hypothetical protein [Paenibacillus sp. PvR098]MBP2440978.1 hypothetical protein [Paenibacillus sp. PvP052]